MTASPLRPLPYTRPPDAPQRLAMAQAAVDAATAAIAAAWTDDWPGLVTGLVRALDGRGLDLETVRRAIDDRLAWGFWPGEDPSEGPV